MYANYSITVPSPASFPVCRAIYVCSRESHKQMLIRGFARDQREKPGVSEAVSMPALAYMKVFP